MRVAVVGAGLAGLSAALEFVDGGAHVEVFERSRLLGGRATSFEVDGREIDNGQHVFLACCTEFERFARRVGMEGSLRLQERFDALVLARDGRSGRLRAASLPAPAHVLASFAAYPHLSAGGKLRVVRALLAARFGALPRDDVSFETWLQCMGQNAQTRRAFWDPFFVPALNAPFERIGAADALFTLRTAFLGDAGAARFGFSTVPLAHFAAAAAARVHAMHLSAPVVAIDDCSLQLLDGSRRGFDAIVLAVGPRQAAKLLGEPQRYGVEHLDTYDPYPIVDVHLWHDGGALDFAFAAALDSPLQWIFEKAPGYLCASFSAAGEYLQLPTAKLEALAWSEAQAFVPALRAAALVRSAVTRNPEATWLPRLGAGRTAQSTSHPAIAIAGAWTDTGWPDTMESAVRSGIAAARAIGRAAAPRIVAAEDSSGGAREGRVCTPGTGGGRLGHSLARAVDWLLKSQDAQGWWSGELETNVTMTAEHVLLFRFLGLPLDALNAGAVEHILRNQREDGSWALYYDGPADLSTTIEAYVALKVLGLDSSRDEMRRALRVIHALGGVVKARVFTKIWLALFGVYPWDGVPSLPPEIVFFPLWMPFNLYDFACWARGTVAPLTIVVSMKPVRALGVDVSEIVLPGTHARMRVVRGSGWLMAAEKLQKCYERLPIQPLRNVARRRVARWVIERQEADGSWGGIQPPWVYSLIGLSLMGYDLEHPVMRKGLEGMARFTIADAQGWRFLACMSPVWDTAWAVRALALAGLGREHPAMRRAVAWMLREQIPDAAPGDWRMKCPQARGNGWAFEFDNDAYPDIDDTTIVVLALLEGGDRGAVADAVERARVWTLAMRSRNGAWAAFDRDNTRELLYRMPFSDFGAMIDPPTEDVTAHVVEMLAALGCDERDPYVARALDYLLETQQPSGSWFGRWGVNYVYGTWCVLSALRAIVPDVSRRSARLQRAIERAAVWLLSVQNSDGGWGESCHSYADASFAGIGQSTPSQTAWAVNALQIAGYAQLPAVHRGLEFLCERQLPDGTWDEPECTGTGFPGDFYINYHLYRHLFPTMALAMDEKIRNDERASAPPLSKVKDHQP